MGEEREEGSGGKKRRREEDNYQLMAGKGPIKNSSTAKLVSRATVELWEQNKFKAAGKSA